MKNKIDISLIITNYNRSHLIERAIRSCQNQLILNTAIEIIIVDDFSEDDSLKKIVQFQDNVILKRHTKNKGIGAASSTGLMSARGEYYMRVDSDDYLSNISCSIHKAILDNNPKISFSYSDIIEVNEHGEKQKIINLYNKNQLYKYGAGVMFRTEDVKKIGGYDKNFRNAEDYDLFLRLYRNHKKGFHVPIPLYRYYKHNDNISKNIDRKKFWKKAKEKNNV